MSSIERGGLKDPLNRPETKTSEPINLARGQRPESGRTESQLPADRVEVSSRALDLRSFTERALALPEVRTERVERLKAAIAEGSFNPSSGEIAQSILRRTPDQSLF